VRTRHIAMPITLEVYLPRSALLWWVTTSEYVRQYLISEGVRPEKVVTIHTGIEIKKFNPDTAPGNLRQEIGVTAETHL